MKFSEFLNYINGLYNYSLYCYSMPQTWIGCGKFWGVCYLAAILFLFFFCCFMVAKIYRNHKDWKNYLAKKEARARIADGETMAKHKWNADFD